LRRRGTTGRGAARWTPVPWPAPRRQGRRRRFAAQASLSPWLNPGSGGTTPMLPGGASVITQAVSSGWAAKAACTASRSLYGRTIVSLAWASVTPGCRAGRTWRRRTRDRRDAPVLRRRWPCARVPRRRPRGACRPRGRLLALVPRRRPWGRVSSAGAAPWAVLHGGPGASLHRRRFGRDRGISRRPAAADLRPGMLPGGSRRVAG
jgi:hypothetical protein